MNNIDLNKLKAFLDGLYYVYARRELINPDPLYFLYNYKNVRDLEIVGLVASSLAYGRVSQIMKSVNKVLSCLTSEPRKFLLAHENPQIVPENFKHRFTTADDINNLLKNIADTIKEYDSLENFLSECLKTVDYKLLPALDIFSARLSRNKKEGAFSLVTSPKDGSACKRLFLFLKWLVRHDEVDPGGWTVIKPCDLVVPTDTHMYNISRQLGFTNRKQADLKTAIEITEGFKTICPEDPAKYDFVLTRFGIRTGLNGNKLPDFN